MDQIKEITENLYILKSKNEEIINVLLKKKGKSNINIDNYIEKFS